MALRIVLVLAVLSCFASAQRMVFEDPSSSDGVVVESSDPSVVDPNVDTRLFHGGSLLGGLLGGIKQKEICSANCGPGNPALSYQCCSYGYSQCCYGNAGGFGGKFLLINPRFFYSRLSRLIAWNTNHSLPLMSNLMVQSNTERVFRYSHSSDPIKSQINYQKKRDVVYLQLPSHVKPICC